MGVSRNLVVAAAAAAAVVLSAPAPAALADGVRYLRLQQNVDGGFGEPGEPSSVGLTAWAVVGLETAGSSPRRPGAAADYLVGRRDASVTDLELRIMALHALGRGTGSLLDRLAGHRRRDGRIGSTVNSTIWGILAFRAAGRPAGRATVRYLLRAQRPSGGWSWTSRGAADSNDTAAALQALRAAGVPRDARAVVRGLRFLRRLQNPDGGFELTAGRGSDAQSTAWAAQAFLAARRAVGRPAFRYLARLQRRNGSYRYSTRFGTTPVWVTAQVVPAVARRAYPPR
jgi:prenyltransferase beta subunit